MDISGKGGIKQGGASRVAANIFYELKKRGIRTYFLGYKSDFMRNDKDAFFLAGGTAQKSAREILNKAKLNKLVSESRLGRMAYYTTYSLTGVALENAESWLAQVKPDVVLASSIQDFVVLRKLKPYLGSAKILYVEHANASGKYSSAFDYNIMGLTFGTGRYVGLEAARKRFFSFFDGVIALNKEQSRNVRRYNNNVTIIHSSILMSVTSAKREEVQALRRRLGIKNDDKVVLYFGRLLDAQKNVSVLILAFKAMKMKGAKLLVVGDGRSRELYEQMARGDDRIRVISAGFDDRVLACYYSMADLYVLPSLWESFNATFIEAANFGAAVLLSSKSINEDIRERFGNALYTFDPSNANELKSKIERFFEDKKLQKKLNRLSEQIASEYSKKSQMDGYAKALKEFYTKGKLPKVTSA